MEKIIFSAPVKFTRDNVDKGKSYSISDEKGHSAEIQMTGCINRICIIYANTKVEGIFAGVSESNRFIYLYPNNSSKLVIYKNEGCDIEWYK